jgi:ribosomal-protein-alanine N-acetyltransferase
VARTYEVLTSRLRLHALSLEEARLALRGDRAELSERIGATVPAAWPGPDLAEGLPIIARHMAQIAGDERWVWMMTELASTTAIGDIGFHGPVMGATSVELGYSILPDYRGRGYATEAASELVDWAFAQPGVERVIVKIAPGNAQSLRVAAKLGMRETVSDEPEYRCFEQLRAHR